MMKIPPAMQFLRLDIKGNPTLIEEATELFSRYGEGLNAPIVGCLLVWNFKIFEPLNRNKLLVDSQVNHEHRFPKYVDLSLDEVKQTMLESYKESSELFQRELKYNEINHYPKDMPEDQLEKYSRGLLADLKKRLF
jgi:hypothetical protein